MYMKEGKHTTENKHTLVAMAASIALPTLAALVEALQGSGLIENGTLLALIGVLGSVLSALGYNACRAHLKGKHLKLESDRIKMRAMEAASKLEKK
jgi:hypothetical protein